MASLSCAKQQSEKGKSTMLGAVQKWKISTFRQSWPRGAAPVRRGKQTPRVVEIQPSWQESTGIHQCSINLTIQYPSPKKIDRTGNVISIVQFEDATATTHAKKQFKGSFEGDDDLSCTRKPNDLREEEENYKITNG